MISIYEIYHTPFGLKLEINRADELWTTFHVAAKSLRQAKYLAAKKRWYGEQDKENDPKFGDTSDVGIVELKCVSCFFFRDPESACGVCGRR